ncbi:MAG: hypothetical protein E6J91_50555 [Deltaproteobacteria bacterium]|nr:MAG: hypothetical protein E6J91_50555 [Deltaproteobacteria bacterium]
MSAQHRRIRIWVSGLVLGALPFAALATTLSSSLVPRFADALPRLCAGTGNPAIATVPCFAMTPTSQTTLDHYEIAARPFSQQILPARDVNGNPFNKTPVFGYGPNIAGKTPVCDESGSLPTSCFHYPAASIAAKLGTPVQVNWLNQLVDNAGNPVTYPAGVRVDQGIHWANPRGICDDGRQQTDCVGRTGFYQGPIPMIPHLHGAMEVNSASDGIPEAWYLPANVPPEFQGHHGSDYCQVTTAGARDCTFTPGAALFQYPNPVPVPATNYIGQPPTMLFFHDHTLGVTLQNIYMGLLGAYVISGVPPVDVATLPAGDYDIPLVIQDKSFNTDGTFHEAEDGNIEVVNGKSWPYLNVEPRRYRFRIVSASIGIYLKLNFSRGLAFTQIGGDQGFLPNPQVLNTLVAAPGERLDVVVDFAGLSGRIFTLNTDSVQVLQIRVNKVLAGADTSVVPPSLPFQRIPDPTTLTPVKVTLFDSLLGAGDQLTAVPMRWDDITSESVAAGTIQEWDIYNASTDSHPIHLHEAAFQVMDRENLDGSCIAPCGPRPGETGLKDTVIADRGQITRVRADFRHAKPGLYAWHCHITEHEDDEMMRPLCITDPLHLPATPTLDGFAGCPSQ